MMLIALAGPAGAGKTTAAEHLRQQHDFHRMAFADPLKDMAAACIGTSRWDFEQRFLHDRLSREVPINGLGVSPRQIMQTLGTEWGRQTLDPDIWIKHARMRLAELAETREAQGHPLTGIVFDDLRFDNEAAMIRAQGGTVVHLYRSPEERGAVREHTSEAGIMVDAEKDQGIWNTGTLDQLRQDLDSTLEMIQRGRAA